MYPYPQQIGRSHSFLIIKAPHLSCCNDITSSLLLWWYVICLISMWGHWIHLFCDWGSWRIGVGVGGWVYWKYMSRWVTKMSLISRCDGAGLHFNYVHEQKTGFFWLSLTTWNRLMPNDWSAVNQRFPFMIRLFSPLFYSCLMPNFSPSPEQGREFSQPWSSARSRSLKTITGEVKSLTALKTALTFLLAWGWIHIKASVSVLPYTLFIIHKTYSIVQMSRPSWTWRTWTRRRCVLLDHWTLTPSLWLQSLLSPPTSPIKGLVFVPTLTHARALMASARAELLKLLMQQ